MEMKRIVVFYIIALCICVEGFRVNSGRISVPMCSRRMVGCRVWNGLDDSVEDQVQQQTEPIQNPQLPTGNQGKLLIDKSLIYTVPQDDYIVVGKILTTYKLKGEVKVKAYTLDPQVKLCEPGYRFLKIPYNDEKVIPIKIERGRCSGQKDVYIVKFEGFDTMEQAQRLFNTFITVPLSSVPPLEENTYYSRDLMGLNVYLHNDVKKTMLGNIVGFIHRSDLVGKQKHMDICEDLIEVQMDMKVSLKTLIDVSNAAQQVKDSLPEEEKNKKGVDVVTETEIYNADEVVEMDEEFESPHFKSMVYVKFYECTICKKEFTNHSMALLHEKEHENKSKMQEEYENKVRMEKEAAQEDVTVRDETDKLKVISLNEVILGSIKKPVRRFYVPLIRNETVKYIDVENKSIYIDPLTIFIGEDPIK